MESNFGTGSTAAGNAFYLNVQRRVFASRECRRVLNEVLYETNKQAVSNYTEAMPDYAEIVRQINICLDEIRPRLNMGELTQMLLTTPIVELGNLLKKLEKMQRPVQQLNRFERISPEAFLDDPGIFFVHDPD